LLTHLQPARETTMDLAVSSARSPNFSSLMSFTPLHRLVLILIRLVTTRRTIDHIISKVLEHQALDPTVKISLIEMLIFFW
jgi:hypothetical protein